MKKVFLSIPMNGRTKENIEKSIEKMKAVITAYLGEEVEFIDTIVLDMPPYDAYKEAVWYLGKSIELMSQADIFVYLNNTYEYGGCAIECDVAQHYGIQCIMLERNLIAPDILEIEREKWSPNRYEPDVKIMPL